MVTVGHDPRDTSGDVVPLVRRPSSQPNPIVARIEDRLTALEAQVAWLVNERQRQVAREVEEHDGRLPEQPAE